MVEGTPLLLTRGVRENPRTGELAREISYRDRSLVSLARVLSSPAHPLPAPSFPPRSSPATDRPHPGLRIDDRARITAARFPVRGGKKGGGEGEYWEEDFGGEVVLLLGVVDHRCDCGHL